MLHLGLFLASTLLEAPIPEKIGNKAAANPVVKRLAAQVCHRLFRESDQTPENVATVLFHLQARDHLRDGLRYGLSLALTPTPAEWGLLRLPPSVSFLYYLLRPLRLAAKYGRTLILHVLRPLGRNR
eukprot:GHVT01093607.1.p2 GENE.GHVT01093607.1~~GHVT01093607.1.p2  ORF type:complete len:127 (-),score=19.01 GHVT01093607.1:299-679(-)